MDGAAAWVEQQISQDETAAPGLIARLIDIWPAAAHYQSAGDRGDQGRARMLRLLAQLGGAALTLRFLREILLQDYNGIENQVLPEALAVAGPAAAKGFLADLIESRFFLWPDAMLELLLRVGELADFDGRDALRDSVLAALAALPEALKPSKEPRKVTRQAAKPGKKISATALRDLFTLAWRCGLMEEAETAAAVVANHPKAITPGRTIPAALKALPREDGFAGSAAYLTLWRHAADSLLARSAEPPEEPRDWAVGAGLRCSCELCARLKAFCKDPEARVGRFPLRKELRKHLHRQIDRHRLDMSHVTERRGRPFTLVCTKNRASYKRRLKQYAKDIKWMRSLTEREPGGEIAAPTAPEMQRLRESLAAAE